MQPEESRGEIAAIIVRGTLAGTLLLLAALHPRSPVNAESAAFSRFVTVLIAGYLYYLLFVVVGQLNRRYFGRCHVLQGNPCYVDTYRSRSFSLCARLVLSVILVMIVAHGLEADDVLRTSGLIAALLVVIGFSQSAWAPDYISGLLILYSEIYKEGDTLKLLDGDQPFIGEVYRIKAFHTEMLSVVDNHRVLIRNSRMREYTIHNLSKFASARGLRERLSFKIGYDTPDKQVDAMFRAAFAAIARDRSIPIERQYDPEIHVHDTGDHAVEWSVFYYTKDTRKLLRTRHAIIATILATSRTYRVSLATPLTHTVELGASARHVLGRQSLAAESFSGYGRQFTVPLCTE